MSKEHHTIFVDYLTEDEIERVYGCIPLDRTMRVTISNQEYCITFIRFDLQRVVTQHETRVWQVVYLQPTTKMKAHD